jgi:hypothetical protein
MCIFGILELGQNGIPKFLGHTGKGFQDFGIGNSGWQEVLIITAR